MFESLKNKAVDMALSGIRAKYINPALAGLGQVHEMSWRDGKLHLVLTLEGLPDSPISVTATDIWISQENDAISVGAFDASLPFARNALNRFGRGPFPIPEGAPRSAIRAARGCLGL
ncbi:MAG: hypothetical protein HDQ44_00745 [Desulfovibrio sp.]|nr:hypothetical protein [Desulfovibrio sp.]